MSEYQGLLKVVDINLATLLKLKGIKLVKVEHNNPYRATFCFEHNKKSQEIYHNYAWELNDYKISLRGFNNARQAIKLLARNEYEQSKESRRFRYDEKGKIRQP